MEAGPARRRDGYQGEVRRRFGNDRDSELCSQQPRLTIDSVDERPVTAPTGSGQPPTGADMGIRHASTTTLILCLTIVTLTAISRAETVSLSSLQVANIHPDMAKPQIDKSAGGNPISLGGKQYEHG